MFDVSMPYLTHYLKQLSAILAKAETHCGAKKIDPNVLLTARLFPDMLPLTRQVMIACDFVKGCGARLAAVAVPSYEDNEKTFAELQARIAKTLDYVGSLKKEQFADAASRTVSFRSGGQERSWPAQEYFYNFVLPNFYFHVTTAYNILRHNGIELGKRDYLGWN